MKDAAVINFLHHPRQLKYGFFRHLKKPPDVRVPLTTSARGLNAQTGYVPVAHFVYEFSSVLHVVETIRSALVWQKATCVKFCIAKMKIFWVGSR